MHASDPSLPLYALFLSVVTFGIGYLAGRLHRAWLRHPRTGRYGSMIRRTR